MYKLGNAINITNSRDGAAALFRSFAKYTATYPRSFKLFRPITCDVASAVTAALIRGVVGLTFSLSLSLRASAEQSPDRAQGRSREVERRQLTRREEENGA